MNIKVSVDGGHNWSPHTQVWGRKHGCAPPCVPVPRSASNLPAWPPTYRLGLQPTGLAYRLGLQPTGLACHTHTRLHFICGCCAHSSALDLWLLCLLIVCSRPRMAQAASYSSLAVLGDGPDAEIAILYMRTLARRHRTQLTARAHSADSTRAHTRRPARTCESLSVYRASAVCLASGHASPQVIMRR